MLYAKSTKGYPRPSRPMSTKGERYIVAELNYDSGISVSASGFKAAAAKSDLILSLNSILEGFAVSSCTSHFGMSDRELAQRSLSVPSKMPKSVSSEFAQSGVVQIVPRRGRDCAALVKLLAKHHVVWKAYEAPQLQPAMATPNMEPCQVHLGSRPHGVGAMASWEYQGGQGEGIAVCDIEGDWNFDHEDLPRVTLFGGTLVGGDWKDHGTAVLGEIVGKANGRGIAGIAPKAKPRVHSAFINGKWNIPQAIMNSAQRMQAGDVILIELQGEKFEAVQFWDDTFSAIRAATAKGIMVVEAAGNGGLDFDAAVYNGSNLQKDSGAIVVGAGVPVTNYYDHTTGSAQRYTKIGVPRSRAWFSNYGKIVNVQGYGDHVTTLGYGDAQGGPEDQWYTHRFSGTSSASPIVTGVVACLQGIALTTGGPFSPSELRALLISTGTPQADDPDHPKSQHIGPLPDIEKAIANF